MDTYKLNTDKKVLTINDKYANTKTGKNIMQTYASSGYFIRFESDIKREKRAKAAAARADKLTDADIKEALKDRPKELAEYERIKHEKNFFSARKYFRELQK